jgi:hypothetical protein
LNSALCKISEAGGSRDFGGAKKNKTEKGRVISYRTGQRSQPKFIQLLGDVGTALPSSPPLLTISFRGAPFQSTAYRATSC